MRDREEVCQRAKPRVPIGVNDRKAPIPRSKRPAPALACCMQALRLVALLVTRRARARSRFTAKGGSRDGRAGDRW